MTAIDISKKRKKLLKKNRSKLKTFLRAFLILTQYYEICNIYVILANYLIIPFMLNFMHEKHWKYLRFRGDESSPTTGFFFGNNRFFFGRQPVFFLVTNGFFLEENRVFFWLTGGFCSWKKGFLLSENRGLVSR